MPKALRQDILRNPRSLHTVRRVALSQANMWSSVLRSIGFASSSPEEVVAFVLDEEVADMADSAPEVFVGPRCSPSDQGLEFAKGHFDRVKPTFLK